MAFGWHSNKAGIETKTTFLNETIWIQCLAKTWIYLTPYVLNEFLTADRSFSTKYFWKISYRIGSSHLYASFGTFCVKIGQLFEAQWDLKLSKEFEIDVIFLRKHRFYRFRTFFKDSLCLEKLKHLYSNCAKRSVKMWATIPTSIRVFSKIFCWEPLKSQIRNCWKLSNFCYVGWI